MKRQTIRSKFFLYIVLLLGFLLTWLITVIYTSFFEFLKKEEMETAISAAQKTKQNIEIVLKMAYEMTIALSEKSNILGELKRGDLSYHSDAPELNRLLEEFLDINQYFDNVYIIGDNGAFITSDPQSDSDSILERCKLPEKIQNDIDIFYSITNKKSYFIDTHDNKIAFISSIQDNFSGQYLGIMIIDINRTFLRESFSISSFESQEKVIIVNRKGEILLSFPYNVYFGDVIKEHKKILELQATQINGKVFNKDSIIVSDTINYSDWKIIRIINTDRIFRSVNMLSRTMIVIFAIFIVFSLVGSLILSVSITRPILRLNEEIKKVEKGDLSVSIAIRRNDELGELSGSFNKMVMQLRNLIREKVEQQKKKSETEFQILEAQINPHFLYNTLNSIKWLAIIQNVENISEMTSAIINLLKYNLSTKTTLVTLADEIESVRNYINIQKYRYGNNFNIDYDLDPATLNLKILKFILQPLVENSIFHGFKNYKYGGEIKITSYINEQNLLIEVKDNGSGISVERMEEIIADRMHKGIGLSNIHERIGLYFGNDFGIKVDSKPGEGTCVTVKLPVLRKDSDLQGES